MLASEVPVDGISYEVPLQRICSCDELPESLGKGAFRNAYVGEARPTRFARRENPCNAYS